MADLPATPCPRCGLIGGVWVTHACPPPETVYSQPVQWGDLSSSMDERKRAESYGEALAVIASFLEREETAYARESVRARIRRLLDGGSWHDALTDEEVARYG